MATLVRDMTPQHRFEKFESVLTAGTPDESKFFKIKDMIVGVFRCASEATPYSITLQPKDGLGHSTYLYDSKGSQVFASDIDSTGFQSYGSKRNPDPYFQAVGSANRSDQSRES